MCELKIGLAIPTYNGGAIWKESAEKISSINNKYPVLVIDSSSSDESVHIALKNGFVVKKILSSDFNHGGTRNLCVEECNTDVVIFFTQDAIPTEGCIERIADAFKDSNVACAYGRQLPHVDANAIAAHARHYNYPQKSHISNSATIEKMGIKTVFMSNSFSAYRVSIFKELEGFPVDTILCEDMYFAAKAVIAGYSIAYVADAKVHHSHNYTMRDEFTRYFDIGVFHSDESWIRKKFGGAGGEGKKFLISELRYLLKNNPKLLFNACINNFSKIVGYKIGLKYKKLPINFCKKLSMHKKYWDSKKNGISNPR